MPERLGWRKGGRKGRGRPGSPSSISFQACTPPTLPAAPGARSEPAPHLPIPKTIPTHLSQGPDHPPPLWATSRLYRRSRAAPPPLLSPSSRAPTRTCALHAATANLWGTPSCPQGGQAQEEGEGAARGSVRAGNAVPRGPPVRRETERGDRWGWGPQAILTGSTVAILDRSDRTTAPEGGGKRKKMRFQPDWSVTVHVTDVSVWPRRRLRKSAAAWVTRGFWEVKSLSFLFFFRSKEILKRAGHVVDG